MVRDSLIFNSRIVVRSLERPGNVWKLTNFSNSRGLLIVEDLESTGTPQYNPAEIIFSRPASGSPTFDRVHGASWSVGCILYELCSGKRAFPDLYSLWSYWQGDCVLPSLTVDSNPQLFAGHCPAPGEESIDINQMHFALDDLAGSPILSVEFSSNETALDRINNLLCLSLSRSVEDRPSLNQINQYSSANVIRTKVETVQVILQKIITLISEAFKELALELILLTPVAQDPNTIRDRWSFLRQIEVCPYLVSATDIM